MKKTIAFTICRLVFFTGLAMCLFSPAWAALNLEVPLEMVDQGISSLAGTGASNFARSSIYLNPSDYDGATYYFEIVARNTDTTARSVYLRLPPTDYAAIVVPAGTNDYTRFRQATPWTPAAGKSSYLVRVDRTPTEGQLIVQTARIIVQQINATKTRVQIPLAQMAHDGYQAGFGWVDGTTSTTYTQGNSDYYSIWRKDLSQYADLVATNPWTFEACLYNNGSAISYAALFNRSSGLQVAGTEISVTGSTITLVDISFSDGAANFAQGAEYEVRIRTSNASSRANLASAGRLYVSLTNLSKAEIVYRTGRMSTGTSETHLVEQRTVLDSSLFTNPAIYYEASGLCADNAQRVFLRDHGASDSGTGGVDVSGSGINFSSAAKIRMRTAAVTPTDADRFYTRIAPSTGSLRLSHAWVVIQAQATPTYGSHYVWSGGSNTSPYITWDTAAHSIQDAIDVADSGSTIVVRGGTFYENILMDDGVNLLNDTGYMPVINGGGTGTAVSFEGSYPTGCSLDGFYVTNSGDNGGIYFRGTGFGIDNNTIVRNCSISANNSAGVMVSVSGNTVTTAPVIDNNTLDNNAEEGILVIDASGGSEAVVISNNTIRNHGAHAGINIGGASHVSVSPNNMIHGNYAGIGFHTGSTLSEPVEIAGNFIYANSQGGISLEDAGTATVTISENAIYQNTWGGIGIQNACDLVITRNDIYLNGRGGIHTGTDQAGGAGFLGNVGSAFVTIRQNKVHDNGGNGYGGGIDVRHASGIIENNLVYDNHRGGIRFGDYITEIINNTVVNNGGNTFGGGIVFDALSGLVNDPPDGSISINLPYPLIRNNISAYNQMAGLRSGYMPGGQTVCPDNPVYSDGNFSRNYNLLYANFPWNIAQNRANDPACLLPTGFDKSCVNQQYGGCGASLTPPFYIIYPNDIMADPLFLDMSNNDYRLQAGSPARGSGVGGLDMGAYGGIYPVDW